MNIQITAYGLGSGHGEAAGVGYDDTEIKKELEAVKKQLAKQPKGGAAHDDTDLHKQIAAVAEQVSKIADTRKEYQAAYVPRKDLGSDLDMTPVITIEFKKPFSKIPFVKVTFDLKINSAKLIYVKNVTETGFDIATKEPGDLWDLQGLWYEAYLID
nr:MAG TPA: H-type lectin domain [Caudoviricetes sp.]